ncbi:MULTISPECIES: LysM peptidoglycan-binding domain-containing protein [unclassified Paenibacillus]|uniref:LysM peptidoglycan-binding domain-containing protein n=1 Tax=unclassified Paenibacillus TaxID=185978 RepID=UPI001AE24DA0|nr:MULTISPECIES: LysM peptidoglycan-binding domain-containing protein [unclassified Paenibacillus]MBP1156599.1 stage VI sporulation protein D [Paenibacillus sp. PvP091]MBP1172663.1 stage VI sporulation protein D [Paenibacillus sp. PvR098]MBP2439043.1 stage VI sporulation protein D [Paenibacillus sp. PvP052]
MTKQHNGLRFDIYERVHLSEGVLGIKELEGVELIPHIQVLPQGEQAVLRGNLLLTGTYVDELERTDQTLQHLIPVEITLPMNRVQRVEDIAVEIENFDVDLLSARSLNVTGVLSLGGVENVSSSESDQWRETEEEVVFVHEVPERRSEIQEESSSLSESAGEEIPRSEQAPAEVLPQEKAEPSSQQEPTAPPSEPAKKEEKESEPEASGAVKEEEPAAEAAANTTEKKEMKVGLGSKKTTDAAESAAEPIYKSFGLASLLKHGSSKSDTRPPEDGQSTAQKLPSEKVEWKNLLLSANREQQEFKKLRMCIVQKEETLETIAKRYDLNPREIALYNRLGEGELMEGQIVYIPK